MKLKLMVLAVSLASFSGLASGFDFGKLLEEGINQELNKGKTSQTAPGTTEAPAKQKFDALQLGRTLLSGYTPQEETRIGRQIAGDLLGAVPLVRDDKLQRYVNEVGNWVALQSGRKDITWHFGVLDTEDINAFAAPGGYVFVTKGLYRRLHNEAELAGVLAHEIAHVTLKHHLKLLRESSVISALGEAAGNKVRGNDQVVQNLIGNGAEIMARNLDKNAEFEADRLAVVLAARAGYDAYGLPGVLQEIGHASSGDSAVALLFKTHPQPADRLAALGEAVDGRLDALKGKDLPGRFYRIR